LLLSTVRGQEISIDSGGRQAASSTALSSRCGQCLVDSGGTRLKIYLLAIALWLFSDAVGRLATEGSRRLENE